MLQRLPTPATDSSTYQTTAWRRTHPRRLRSRPYTRHAMFTHPHCPWCLGRGQRGTYRRPSVMWIASFWSPMLRPRAGIRTQLCPVFRAVRILITCLSQTRTLSERHHQASWHTNGIVPSSATTRYPASSSGTNSLSPHNLPMDMSPTGSTALGSNFTNSPRHSAHIYSRAQKRAHSLSHIGDNLEFTKLIRASPTSLACINSAASNASASPMPQNMAQCGHFGHLIARSPQSGSANSLS